MPNKTFCILPWTHFFHDPTGKVMPCCSANCRQPGNQQPDYGNMRDYDNHMDIINQKNFNELRLNMLEGKESSECQSCYDTEKHGGESFRTSKNSMLDQMISLDEIRDMTNPDGSLRDFKKRYWDVRFSNVCNLSCRMCGPEYSHTWAKEVDKTFNGRHIVKAQDSDNWTEIVNKYGPLDDLYEIYFAGGEVMFQKEHWQMLDHLVDIGKTDVMVMYVTNLTKLDYDGFKLLDYIPKFRDVTFTVSLDGTGDLLEYIRWGSKWDQIVKNLDTVKDLPNVHLRVNHVTMWYNVLALPETLDFLYGQGYLTEPHELDLYVAHEPENHVGALPLNLKAEAVSLIKSNTYYPLLKDKLDAVMRSMMENTFSLPIQHVKDMDQRRGCNLLNHIPKLSSYFG
jgi:MoaA/NifB/PqqE/SkfB family radical SAM enzyme